MQPVHDAVQLVLDGHDPYPAITVDRGWALVAHNRGAGLLMAGLPEELLAPPVNVLRASLHPDGLAPRIANLGQRKAHLLERLARQATRSPATPRCGRCNAELASYPAPEDDGPRGRGERRHRAAAAAHPRRRAALLEHRHERSAHRSTSPSRSCRSSHVLPREQRHRRRLPAQRESKRLPQRPSCARGRRSTTAEPSSCT